MRHSKIEKAHREHIEALSFNEKIGLYITNMIGTMYCAYVFCLFAFVALPQAIESRSFTTIVNWASSNWMQLVLLPIILVGQNVANKALDHKLSVILSELEMIRTQLTPLLGSGDNSSTGMNGVL